MLVCTLLIGAWFSLASPASGAVVLPLAGSNQWAVTNSNGSIQIPAIVPGGIYTDLMRNDIIGDPYFRKNDILYKWIGYDNWTYSRNFEVTQELLNKERVTLVCHGLDAVSQIFINGKQVANTDNMFVRYVIDIKDELQIGQNNIQVKFQSAVLYAKEKFEEYKKKYKYIVYPECPVAVQNGECYVNFIRKIQSSFSWDWGPSFPSQGIWKNIEIEAYDSLIIRDLTVSSYLENGIWKLNLNLFVERTKGPQIGDLDIKLSDWILVNQTVSLAGEEVSIPIKVAIPTGIPIELWWPQGYGLQKLYNLTATYKDKPTSEFNTVVKKIGFRTAELVRDNITQSEVSGQSFYFRINDVPIFAKGSNLIPLDSFMERVTTEKIRWLMQSAVAANMNMLRIWGGGMYEADEIYQLADELGVLLWQDFVFACSLYPVDGNFLASVTTEVTQQVRRLQSHPSLCVWSGNNENEGAIAGNWWPISDQHKLDYKLLYGDVISQLVQKDDPLRPFLSSSPTNGLPYEMNGEIAPNPWSKLYGDVHFYNYASDAWNWTIYPRPRFASEYGYQSFPTFSTMAAVSQPSDWTFPSSDFLDHRQHHSNGNVEMKAAICRQFDLPSSNDVKEFKDFLYLTQVNQAMSIKTETEHYRRSRSQLVNGEGYTMGALYWQLNDIWQGASWSSIDFPGNWKMLHYFAHDFFAPFLVSPFMEGDVLKVSVVSDITHDINLTMTISVYKWSSFTPLFETDVAFTQPAQFAKVIFQSSVQDLLEAAGDDEDPNAFFFYFRLQVSQPPDPVSENFFLPTKFKKAVGLQKANILIQNVTQVSDRAFLLTLTSDRIAPFVWLEIPGVLGTFTRNGFLMIQPTVRVGFTSNETISLAELTDKLAVQSLMDTQDENSSTKDAFCVLFDQE